MLNFKWLYGWLFAGEAMDFQKLCILLGESEFLVVFLLLLNV